MTSYTRGIYIYDNLKEHTFEIHYTHRSFASCGKLSGANIPLKKKTSNGFDVVVSLHHLINFEVDLFIHPVTRPEHLAEPFERLINVLQKCNTMQLKEEPATEKEVLVELADKILIPLFRNVTYESSYRSYLVLHKLAGACSHLGIGSKQTWYGEPDMAIEGVYVLSTSHEDYDEEEEEEYKEPEHSEQQKQKKEQKYEDNVPLFLECKKVEPKNDTSKLVATSVLCSFMHHSENDALIPTILVNKSYIRICMYNANNDILLISTSIPLSNKKGISTTAVLLIWLVVHHR